MANWVVTGGAGFIGSHIVEELLKNGESVKVIDNFISGKKDNLEFPTEYKGKLEIIEGDIRDLALLKNAFADVDFISHQAALRSVPKSYHNPPEYDEVNVRGTLNVLMAAKEVGVKRVIYASSSSIYGERENLPEKESDLPSPISIYAATKLNGEYYCKVFTALYDLETVVLRYFNVFGPRQSLENRYAVVIPKFIVSLLKNEAPPVYGDGYQSRDFTYVANVVKANILAAKAENIASRVYNIASGQAHTVMELFTFIKEFLGSKIEPVFKPPRPGDVKHTLADINSASRDLGYKVEVGFESGLVNTINWFRENLEKL